MTTYADIVSHGYMPLRHHDKTFDLALRAVSFAAKIGGKENGFGLGFDEFGRLEGETKNNGSENTHGDILGACMWPSEDGVTPSSINVNMPGSPVTVSLNPNGQSKRDIPGWNWAWGSITLGSGPSDSNSNGADDLDQFFGSTDTKNSSGGSTFTKPAGTQGKPAKTLNEATLRPVYSKLWDEDERFVHKSAGLPSYIDALPAGICGVLMAATNENSQEDIFGPFGWGTIIAPHLNGDPLTGSTVWDLNASNELDNDHKAKFQSLARVWRIPKKDKWNVGVLLGEALFGKSQRAGLAIQMGRARSNICGRAVFADDYFGSTVNTQLQIFGSGSSQADGPFHVGQYADKHKFGTNQDGEPLNSLHLSTRAIWTTKFGEKDAPLAFTDEPYKADQGDGKMTEVYLVYDDTTKHNWIGGQKDGLWRWQVPIPVYPSIPTGIIETGITTQVETGQIETGVSTGQIKTGIETGITTGKTETGIVTEVTGDQPIDEGGQAVTVRDIYNQIGGNKTGIGKAIGDLFGFNPPAATVPPPTSTSGTASQAFNEIYSQAKSISQPARQTTGPHSTVSTLSEFTIPALNFRPQNYDTGANDFRFGGWNTATASAFDIVSPSVGTLTSFGTQQGNQWHYFDNPLSGRTGPTTAGVVAFVPPNVDPTQIIDGKEPTSFPTSTFTFYRTYIGIGAKPTTNGYAANGFLMSGTASVLTIDGVNGTGVLDANSPLTLSRDTLGGTLFGQKIVSEPPATTSGYAPIADGAGSYTWQSVASSGQSDGVFGDGSDGSATLNGGAAPSGMTFDGAITYTMSRDCYYSSLTMSGVYRLVTNSWRLFISGTLTLGASNRISNDGATASGSSGASGIGAQTVGGSSSGVNGSSRSTTGSTHGGAGNNATNSFGGASGAGGDGFVIFTPGGAAGTATAPGASYGELRQTSQIAKARLESYQGDVALTGGAGGASGGVDYTVSATGTFTSGGGGAGGGVVMIAAKVLANSGIISADGGAGGSATAGGGVGGGAGGGGGGGGGLVALIYGSSGSTLGTVQANGGLGGNAASVPSSGPTNGANGSNGRTRILAI
jgi:hypothetical protein